MLKKLKDYLKRKKSILIVPITLFTFLVIGKIYKQAKFTTLDNYERKVSINEKCKIKTPKEDFVTVKGKLLNSSFIGCWKYKDTQFDKDFTHIFLNKNELTLINSVTNQGPKEIQGYSTVSIISINKDDFNASVYVKINDFQTYRKYILKGSDTILVQWWDEDRINSGSYEIIRY